MLGDGLGVAELDADGDAEAEAEADGRGEALAEVVGTGGAVPVAVAPPPSRMGMGGKGIGPMSALEVPVKESVPTMATATPAGSTSRAPRTRRTRDLSVVRNDFVTPSLLLEDCMQPCAVPQRGKRL